jgi:hypothetical protein
MKGFKTLTTPQRRVEHVIGYWTSTLRGPAPLDDGMNGPAARNVAWPGCPGVPEVDDVDEHNGRDDYHDPTAGIGGAPPARSALTLRLWLAGFGMVVCVAAALVLGAMGAPPLAVALLGLLAVVAAVDLVIVVRRKAAGEPG